MMRVKAYNIQSPDNLTDCADPNAGDDAADDSGNANDAADDAAGDATDDTADDSSAAASADVNAFTGAVGADPIPIENDPTAERPFTVNGDTFLNAGAAIQRACDVQKNQCANAANGGDATISVSDCDAQQQECIQANANVAKRGIAGVRARQALKRARALY